MTPVLQPTGRRDEIGLILSGGFPEFDLLGFLLHKRVRTLPLLGGVLGVIGHEVSDVILFDEVFLTNTASDYPIFRIYFEV